jgi:hypothetical protein
MLVRGEALAPEAAPVRDSAAAKDSAEPVRFSTGEEISRPGRSAGGGELPSRLPKVLGEVNAEGSEAAAGKKKGERGEMGASIPVPLPLPPPYE